MLQRLALAFGALLLASALPSGASPLPSSDVEPHVDAPAVLVPAGVEGTGTRRDVVCASPGRKRFQALYVTPAGMPDRSATLLPRFRQAIYDASRYLDLQAQASGARARFRVSCDPSGEVAVTVVHLASPPVPASFSSIVAALAERGFRDARTKYQVYYDGCAIHVGAACPAGQGSFVEDSRRWAGNRNDAGPSYALQYGGQGTGPSWFIVLHESGHTLGAVQTDAPHADGAAHCTDYPDIMCGLVNKDPAGRPQCPIPSQLGEYPWDCGRDDYFDPRPAPGSYLDTHWNLARDSSFLSYR